ncbi:putative hexose phosphate transport protein [Balamuthia mandrillaris]
MLHPLPGVGGTGHHGGFSSPPTLLESNGATATRMRRWQLCIFLGLYVGYTCYYFTRKSFTFVIPSVIEDPNLPNITKAEIGVINSGMGLSYALGKIFVGYFADRVSPTVALVYGLCLCGLSNVGMAAAYSVPVFVIVWSFNGLIQSGGWAPITLLLTEWFPATNRGSVYGLASTSQSAGAAIIALIASFCAQHYGWRMAMVVPSVISFAVAVGLWLTLKDSPRAVGLPPVDAPIDSYNVYKKKSARDALSFVDGVRLGALEPQLLRLGVACCLVNVVRSSIADWMTLFLVEQKGFSIVLAGGCLFWLEIGGIFGASGSGMFSDAVTKGKRGPTNVIFMLGALFSFWMLWHSDSATMTSVSLFIFGFFIYGPKTLVGLHAVELADSRARATAQGVCGMWSGLGTTLAGLPAGSIVLGFGWSAFFWVLFAVAILSLLLLGSLWSAIPASSRYKE